MENVSSTLLQKKSVTAKKAMTNRTKSEFTSHCRIAAKMNFLMLLHPRSQSFDPFGQRRGSKGSKLWERMGTRMMLLLFPARVAHARYSSRMIDRFLYWGDHGKPKSGKIKGLCQPPLSEFNQSINQQLYLSGI